MYEVRRNFFIFDLLNFLIPQLQLFAHLLIYLVVSFDATCTHITAGTDMSCTEMSVEL